MAYSEREIWNVSAVFGEKSSPDGSLLFSPLLNALDIIDGKRGVLLSRVSLPVTLSANYDALVTDGQDNILIAITGQTGTGIAIIDLTSVPEPPPLPYATIATTSRMAVFTGGKVTGAQEQSRVYAQKLEATRSTGRPMPMKHIMNRAATYVRLH